VVVNVTVRFVPLPPKMKPVLGTKLVSEELAVMTNASAGVSRSERVNGIGPNTGFKEVSAAAVGLAVDAANQTATQLSRREIVGGVFVRFTVSAKDEVAVSPHASETVAETTVEPV
jgi:hypothetical protein